MTGQATADLINSLILQSQQLLSEHPFNKKRAKRGLDVANSIWPWSGGYRPSMKPLGEIYLQITKGSVISAVDLIRGIGKYAGLHRVEVEGITGLADTNTKERPKRQYGHWKQATLSFFISRQVMRRGTTVILN